jgi:hypothetical protein
MSTTHKRAAGSPIQDILITANAFQKMQLYTRLAHEELGTTCIMFLIGPNDPGCHTITDVILADGQEASPAHAIVDPEHLQRAVDEAAVRGGRLLGWAFSNGQFPPFHSSTTVQNTSAVLAQLAYHNTVRKGRETYGFAYAVVVNARGEWAPDARVAVMKLGEASADAHEEQHSCPLDILVGGEVPDSPPAEFTLNGLREEVHARIRRARPVLKA